MVKWVGRAYRVNSQISSIRNQQSSKVVVGKPRVQKRVSSTEKQKQAREMRESRQTARGIYTMPM